MFLIAGISSKVKPVGVAFHNRCPACGREVSLHIIHKYLTPHIFFLPTFRFSSSYVATCDHCASVMQLRREAGDAFRRNPSHVLEDSDLSVLQNNSRARCPHCGGALSPQGAFYPHCGNPR